jgi:hypothetical protein
VRDRDVYVRPVIFRPIGVYVGGEVRRPNYYHLTGQQAIKDIALSSPTTNAAHLWRQPFTDLMPKKCPLPLRMGAELNHLAADRLQNSHMSRA